MEKTLQMVFSTAGGGKVTLSLDAPQEDLTAGDVQAAMQVIVDKNIFSSTGGDLTGVVGAQIITREIVPLFTV